MRELILIAVVSYLLGSIPFGYILVRIFQGEDVRLSGSGNIGATNVARKSPMLGALTLILDGGKGFAAVQIARSAWHPGQHNIHLQFVMALAALCAILGHLFPIWLAFRGGKGVATALGAFLRFSPLATLVAVSIFLVTVVISRRVSLGSVVAAALFPSTVWLLQVSDDPAVLGLIGVASLLIVARHYQNILRLLSGTEPRFSLRHK